MDPETEELKKLIRESVELAKDTNRMLHGMRRNARLGRFAKVVWWVAIFSVSTAAYYIYLQPYLLKLEALYGNVQTTTAQAHSFQQQFADFFKQFQPKAQ